MGGEGVGGNQFLMLSSNLLKSKNPMLRVSGWVGGGGNQFPTLDAEFKFAKIQNSHVEGGWVGGGLVETNFKLFMLSPNLLKSKFPLSSEGGGGFGGYQFSTFDAESKFAKIQNSYVERGWGGLVNTNFQLLMLSPNWLKSKFPMYRGGGCVGGTNFQLLILSPNLLKKKKIFAKNVLSFRVKMCLGMVLDFEYQVVREPQ